MKLQDFLAEGTLNASRDLETALMNLPEDKRSWCAGGVLARRSICWPKSLS